MPVISNVNCAQDRIFDLIHYLISIPKTENEYIFTLRQQIKLKLATY